MRVVFMGTPDLASIVLRELASKHDVVGVYTRPDAVRGRGGSLVASPVKAEAQQLNLTVYTPASFKDAETLEELASLAPDVICVCAYGVILPQEVLEVPPLGCLNVHTSLLPRWRGAAPIERAILAGDEKTGVCIMRMEEGLDTGDYCRSATVEIDDLYVSELSNALAHEGARCLNEALDAIAAESVEWVVQDERNVTYAAKLSKTELALSPEDEAWGVVAKVRASSSAHPARTTVAGKPLSVERACIVDNDADKELCAQMEPGDVRFAAKRLFLRAADGAVELLQVKPDGKKSMDARSFAGGIQGIKTKALYWGREA